MVDHRLGISDWPQEVTGVGVNVASPTLLDVRRERCGHVVRRLLHPSHDELGEVRLAGQNVIPVPPRGVLPVIGGPLRLVLVDVDVGLKPDLVPDVCGGPVLGALGSNALVADVDLRRQRRKTVR